jgi:hypothetical protein
MSKSEQYREKAGEHIKLAASCASAEVRQMHAEMAESFLALADKQARASWPLGRLFPADFVTDH